MIRQKQIFAVLGGLALVVSAVGGFCLYQSTARAEVAREACSIVPEGFESPAPEMLAAILDYDCARAIAARDAKQAATLALEFGYPSLLLDHADRSEVFDVFGSLVEVGDHGFFSNDPDFIPAIRHIADQANSWAEPAKRIHDFALSSLPSEIQAEFAFDAQQYLSFLPIWNDLQRLSSLAAVCEEIGCESQPTQCPGPVGLTDKTDTSPSELIELCEPSFEWLQALRRSGVIDSDCTSTLQINRIWHQDADPQAPCFEPAFLFDSLPAQGSADIARYVRSLAVQGRLADVPEGNLAYIATYYPDIAAYLRAN